MTTIIAIRCKDGIVLGTDTQATGFTKEATTKVTELPKRRLIACAGDESYINLFKSHVRRSFQKYDELENTNADSLDILNEAVSEHNQEIQKATSNMPDRFALEMNYRQGRYYPEAVFVTFDEGKKSLRMFSGILPDPFSEANNKATAGSGGMVASVFLRSIEDLMVKADLKADWTQFSTKLVSQLLFVLIRRISYLDAYTSGQDIYLINSGGSRKLENKEIFDNIKEGDQITSTILARTLWTEHAPEVLKILEKFRINEILEKLGIKIQ